MGVDDIIAVAVVTIYLVVWSVAFVSYFRTPRVAWASDLERLLTLAGLIFFGWIGVGAWFFVVRPILKDRLAEMAPESPVEEWRLKHLT